MSRVWTQDQWIRWNQARLMNLIQSSNPRVDAEGYRIDFSDSYGLPSDPQLQWLDTMPTYTVDGVDTRQWGIWPWDTEEPDLHDAPCFACSRRLGSNVRSVVEDVQHRHRMAERIQRWWRRFL